jgi:hypothetical protein
MSGKPIVYDSAPIEQVILLVRGQKVILDRDLASLYGEPTKSLNRAVKRNLDRFPSDFMIQLTAEEAESSRYQFGTLKRGQNIKYLPCAFTEQGVAMLSSVLRSPQAVQVNIAIMRAFVRLRETFFEGTSEVGVRGAALHAPRASVVATGNCHAATPNCESWRCARRMTVCLPIR